MTPHVRSRPHGPSETGRPGHFLMGVVITFAIAALLLVVCATPGDAISNRTLLAPTGEAPATRV